MSGERPTFSRDTDVRIDAWTGTGAATQPMSESRSAWALAGSVVPRGGGLAPVPPDPADWRNPDVGWGVVLPERPGLDRAALGRADDAPEPIRALVAARSGKVVRYRAGQAYADWLLRDWAGGDDLPIATSPLGTGPGCLPSYLLIVGSPADIPWRVQYALNTVRNVGRLDLDDEGLGRYVEALLADWKDSGARYAAPVVWSVDHGARRHHDADARRRRRAALHRVRRRFGHAGRPSSSTGARRPRMQRRWETRSPPPSRSSW